MSSAACRVLLRRTRLRRFINSLRSSLVISHSRTKHEKTIGLVRIIHCTRIVHSTMCIVQADFYMKRHNFFQLRVRSTEKSPKRCSGCFSALSGGVVAFWVRFEIFEKIMFYVFCFLSEPTSMKNVTTTPKSLRCWFSYAPIRVQIRPHRELENSEVRLSS